MSATTADAAGIRSESRYFYVWMGIGFVVVAFGGFAPTYWTKLAAGSFHGPTIIHLHGFLLFSWVCFYLLQTTLVATGRTMDHRNWGLAGIALFSFVLCSILVGQMAVIGVGMVSLVHSSTAWVEANFKEKDVGRMMRGQRATIEVDAYSGQKFDGYVQSIGAGTGSEFSLLPAQNANGNWVKVTQRVPVRIAFSGTPSRPMIAGLSVTARVYFDQNKK